MTESDWNSLIEAIHDFDNEKKCLDAVERLHHESGSDDVPRLISLLNDESFFVREAAAWPLSDLGAVVALPALLDALQKGVEEGHDNDGLLAALADMAEMHRSETRATLEEILQSGNPHQREHANWLIEFCR